MKTLRYSVLVVLLIASTVLAACAPSNAAAPAATTAPSTAATTAPAVVPTTAPAATTAAASSTAVSPSSAATTAPSAAATAAPVPTSAPGYYGDLKIIPVEPNASITFSGWGDSSEQSVYRAAIQRFEQFYPGVKVNYQPIPSNFQTKIEAEMAGGNAPDVFYVDSILMNALGRTGQLMPLDSYMAETGEQASSFLPQLLGMFTYNGTIYGLPKDWGTLGLIYLPEAFKAAGIAEPTANWTWSDLQKAADAIAKTGKYKGYCMAPDQARFGAFVLQDGGNYTNADYTQATLDTPAVIDAGNFIASMKKSGSLVTPADMGTSWCGEAIGKQLVGMTYEGGWLVPFMQQTYPNVDYKAVPLPAGPKGQADLIFTNAIGVNAHTKYPKASAALALFLTSSYNLGFIARSGFAYSTHKSQIDLLPDPIDKAIAVGGTWPNSQTNYSGQYTGQIQDIVSKALERIYLNAQTVQQSFAQAQQEATTALQGK